MTWRNDREFRLRKLREYYQKNKDNPEFMRKRKGYSKKHYQEHKEQLRAWHREHFEENKDRILFQRKEHRKLPEVRKRRSGYNTQFREQLKIGVLSHYSRGDKPECVICGEVRLPCLSLDHINNDGHLAKNRGYNFYLYLKKAGFPDIGLQTLCMNCQFEKRSIYEEEQRLARYE